MDERPRPNYVVKKPRKRPGKIHFRGVDSNTVEKFKVYCGRHGWAMNRAIEYLMKEAPQYQRPLHPRRTPPAETAGVNVRNISKHICLIFKAYCTRKDIHEYAAIEWLMREAYTKDRRLGIAGITPSE